MNTPKTLFLAWQDSVSRYWFTSCAIERINQFEPGEKLWLAHEFHNPYDDRALILNTEDHYIVGYCPRYLLAEIFELFRQNANLEVRVERVNKPPTPLQFRLLCKTRFFHPESG